MRVACWLAVIVKWDPFQPVTGNVQKGRSECTTSFETLRNLVHSTTFCIVFGLFVHSIFLENWCRNVPLASVTWAEGSGLCQVHFFGWNCSSQWLLRFEVVGGNYVGGQGHAKVGIGARSLPVCTQQSQSRTFYLRSGLLLAKLLHVSLGGSLGQNLYLETQKLPF